LAELFRPIRRPGDVSIVLGPDAGPLLGRFERKWDALTATLWLEGEQKAPAEALRSYVMAGPGGVWDLADRHLPGALRAVLREAAVAESLCTAPRAMSPERRMP
jgi:hypothetical protein